MEQDLGNEQSYLAGRRKLLAMCIGIGSAIVVLLLLIFFHQKPESLSSHFIAFCSLDAAITSAFMAGNAAEHKAQNMTSATTTIKGLVNQLIPGGGIK